MKLFYRFALYLIVCTGPMSAHAFRCKVNQTGQVVNAGEADVYVDLTPTIGADKNLIVDLSQAIDCANEDVRDTDHINLEAGSAYGGALKNFSGSVAWTAQMYRLPLAGSTTVYSTNNAEQYFGLPLVMYLTPFGTAGGAVINAGELIASMHLYKIATLGGGNPTYFIWNIYARNSVVIPTGGCDVSARNIVVDLPAYPGTSPVPLTIRCAKPQNIAYYLTGAMAGGTTDVFENTATDSPAGGTGVRLSNRTGPITAKQSVSMGQVGSSPVSLDLVASYARTAGRMTPGSVQALVGVTFIYQ